MTFVLPVLLAVIGFCCSPARAEEDAERLSTETGQRAYLWQRQQPDLLGRTASLPLSDLQRATKAIGGRMQSARSLFDSAPTGRWIYQTVGAKPVADSRKVQEQLHADLSSLPFNDFTTPARDWQRLTRQPAAQKYRAAWLRLAPLLYSNFYLPRDETKTIERVSAAIDEALAPESNFKLRVLHLDYHPEVLREELSALPGMQGVDTAWNGIPEWHSLLAPEGSTRPALSVLPLAPNETRPEKAYVLHELAPGQIPVDLEFRYTPKASRAARYALIHGARFFQLSHGGETRGWVLCAEATLHGARESKQAPYVVDARALDGQPLSANDLAVAIKLAAVAHGSPAEITVSQNIRRQLAPLVPAHRVRAEMPRGWLTMDGLEVKYGPENGYQEEHLATAFRIPVPTIPGVVFPNPKETKQKPINEMNEADENLLFFGSYLAGMKVTGSNFHANTIARWLHLYDGLLADKLSFKQLVEGYQALPPAFRDSLRPHIVDLAASLPRLERLLLATALDAASATALGFSSPEILKAKPFLELYGAIRAEVFPAFAELGTRFDALSNRLTAEQVEFLKQTLLSISSPTVPSPHNETADWMLETSTNLDRWLRGLQSRRPATGPREFRGIYEDGLLAKLLAITPRWQAADYAMLPRLFSRRDPSFGVELLTALAGQAELETYLPTFQNWLRDYLAQQEDGATVGKTLRDRIFHAHGPEKLLAFQNILQRLKTPSALPSDVSPEQAISFVSSVGRLYKTYQAHWAPPGWRVSMELTLDPAALSFLARPENADRADSLLGAAFRKFDWDFRRGEAAYSREVSGVMALTLESDSAGAPRLVFLIRPSNEALPPPLISTAESLAEYSRVPARRLSAGMTCPFRRLGETTRWHRLLIDPISQEVIGVGIVLGVGTAGSLTASHYLPRPAKKADE